MNLLNIITLIFCYLLSFSFAQNVNSLQNSSGRFSTKTSYFKVANEDTEEIKIEGKDSVSSNE